MKDEIAAVTITPSNRGPYIVKGPIRLTLPSGRILETKDIVSLCRCGHSNDKPFCDGTHKKIGFDSFEGGTDFHKDPL